MSLKTKITSRKVLILISVLVIALLVTGATFYLSNNSSNEENAGNGEDINYSPPSEEEKAAAEQNKAEVVKRQNLDGQSSTSRQGDGAKKDVLPIISSWGQNLNNKNVEVTGYVSGVYENGGICTLTLERSGKKVTGKHIAHKDAQTTTCGLIVISRNALSTGVWKATISYSSSTAQGTSKSVNVEVE